MDSICRLIDDILLVIVIFYYVLNRIFSIETTPEKDRDFVRHCVEGLLENINLDSATYPSDEYESITGELDIVGLSPNNDDHIWNAIEHNEGLDVIRFFYHSDADKKAAERFVDKRIRKAPVEEFWKSRT